MSDWESFVNGAQYVPDVVLPQMPDVVQRAINAGAEPPLEYIGAGMTSVVFCSHNIAYKVARNTAVRFLDDESEWLETAASVPWVQDRVAEFFHFDPENVVIVRACPLPGEDMTPYRFGEGNLFDLHREIERHMIEHGWTSPEFKPDSYVITVRGPVLVDASMPSRVGARLLDYANDLIDGRRDPGPHERPSDIAFSVRMELNRTLSQVDAKETLDELERLEASGNQWTRTRTAHEMHDGPAINKKQIAIDIERAQRAQSRAEIESIRQEARNARAACTAARQRAIETCAIAKSVRAKRDALVALAHEYRLIKRAELARQRATRPRRSPGVARSESDDEVRQNIPPELIPTWEVVKRGIGRSSHKSRTETFLEWVESHPNEIVFVEPTDEDYERSYAQRRVSEYRRPRS